jgi:hypothetical protein
MKVPKYSSVTVALMLLSAAHVSATDWRTQGGFFYTANPVTQGTVIKIRVAFGKFDQVRIGEFFGGRYGQVAGKLQVWSKVIPNQVLSYTVPKNETICIDTGNYKAKATKSLTSRISTSSNLTRDGFYKSKFLNQSFSPDRPN